MRNSNSEEYAVNICDSVIDDVAEKHKNKCHQLSVKSHRIFWRDLIVDILIKNAYFYYFDDRLQMTDDFKLFFAN